MEIPSYLIGGSVGAIIAAGDYIRAVKELNDEDRYKYLQQMGVSFEYAVVVNTGLWIASGMAVGGVLQFVSSLAQ